MSYLFNYIGEPWLTQKWTRRIWDIAYGTGPYGLDGNEDLGQMSAWYVLVAAGLHPVCPGDSIYQLTSPVFDEVTLKLDPRYSTGKRFRIDAHNNSAENAYIQSAKLNNQPLQRCWPAHHEIAAGASSNSSWAPVPTTPGEPLPRAAISPWRSNNQLRSGDTT